MIIFYQELFVKYFHCERFLGVCLKDYFINFSKTSFTENFLDLERTKSNS